MFQPDEKLAAVAEIARVEQIQKALANNDEGAVQAALTMVAEIAELENGPMFLICGIGCMLTWIAQDGETDAN